jgi:hypothetical protein
LKQLRDSSNNQDFSDAMKTLFLLFKCDDSPKTMWTNALTPDIIDLSTTNNKDEEFFACMVLISLNECNQKNIPQSMKRLGKTLISLVTGIGNAWKESNIVPNVAEGILGHAVRLLNLPQVCYISPLYWD